MDRLGRLWPHAEPVEHTLGRLGARSARAARGGEMSRIIMSDDGTFDVDVACRPVRTLHVKDGVSLVVFTTVVPYHPRRPTDLVTRSFVYEPESAFRHVERLSLVVRKHRGEVVDRAKAIASEFQVIGHETSTNITKIEKLR